MEVSGPAKLDPRDSISSAGPAPPPHECPCLELPEKEKGLEGEGSEVRES